MEPNQQNEQARNVEPERCGNKEQTTDNNQRGGRRGIMGENRGRCHAGTCIKDTCTKTTAGED